MSRRRQNALRQLEAAGFESHDAPSNDIASNKPAPAPEGQKPQGGSFKVVMLLWVVPLTIFIIITVLRDCLHLW
jgi:hypothetical protein